jgi:hypothetical protein
MSGHGLFLRFFAELKEKKAVVREEKNNLAFCGRNNLFAAKNPFVFLFMMSCWRKTSIFKKEHEKSQCKFLLEDLSRTISNLSVVKKKSEKHFAKK